MAASNDSEFARIYAELPLMDHWRARSLCVFDTALTSDSNFVKYNGRQRDWEECARIVRVIPAMILIGVERSTDLHRQTNTTTDKYSTLPRPDWKWPVNGYLLTHKSHKIEFSFTIETVFYTAYCTCTHAIVVKISIPIGCQKTTATKTLHFQTT